MYFANPPPYPAEFVRTYACYRELEYERTRKSDETNVLTTVLIALPARRAFSVEDGRPHNGSLSRGDIGHTIAYFLDDPAELVTKGHWEGGPGDPVGFLGD